MLEPITDLAIYSADSHTPLYSIRQRMYSYHGLHVVPMAVTVAMGTVMD